MKVIIEKCKKCMQCTEICPVQACKLNSDGNIEIDNDICLSCGCCAAACPNNAIEFE